MTEILAYLRQVACGDQIPHESLAQAVTRFGLSWRQIERIALENGLLPARYQRNRNMFSLNQQLQLHSSSVAVAGCGGLGGYVLEELARLGVGRIVAIDPDVFEVHNLNRQLLCTPETLGRQKALAAAERIQAVNPAVRVTPICRALDDQNATELLAGVHLAVDALDSIASRRALAKNCRTLGIPMIHGAIAGWYGQLTTIYPRGDALSKLYAEDEANKGVEVQLGNPSFTPAVIASLQAAEVCKVLLGVGESLRSRILMIDLLQMEFTQVPC